MDMANWHTLKSIEWLKIILEDRFGYSFELIPEANRCRIAMHLTGDSRTITLNLEGALFTRADSNLPCSQWDATAEGWQAVFGSPLPVPGADSLPTPLITPTDQGIHVAYDILGLTYWMLSRQEEVGRTDLDEHGRFAATSSHAYKHGYLERPVVDEWLHILGQVIQRTWPGIDLKHHSFSMKLSHDVDQPSLYAFKPWRTIARMMAGHIIKRRDLKAFFIAPYVKLATRNELIAADPYNTFGWLMDMSEAKNLRSSFYFICGRTNPKRDADYEADHPVIRKLMRRIYERGHEIGLHPSYDTFQSPELLKKEADQLKRICAEEGIYQTQWGGRMHYLRWEQPTTLRALDEAGMNYDSTLGYADRPGFRCGTCYEYPAFDSVMQQQLSLRIRPLVVMKCSVIDEAYAGLGLSDAASNLIATLKQRCAAVNGVFTLLWHNSYLKSQAMTNIYYRSLGCL